ncbi:hypothetical protein [Cytobacillus gottheilii]|uniref:Glycine zipper domain-containing protein n=1 Tax=Cytobacillus gottheilii TaxID=859144 RepID=A0ABX8FEK8_9BACI|nr:hypothetical protein [Cytobacillus gottheilii]QVY62463.1 hypothetical protein J1899_05120 [Cytobacillus gottheilii]
MEIFVLSLILATGTGVYFMRRKKSILKKKKELERKLPSNDMMLWVPSEKVNIPEGTASLDYIKKHPLSLKEAGIIGAAGSLPSLYYLNEIDGNVYDAMQFAFTDDLTNFHALHNYVEDKYISIFDSNSAEGWITRLEGYVTEQYAADVLTDLGHHVEFPDQANQQGYDLIVDGEPWQVKGGETVSVLNDHFKTNPDTPVITNSALAEEFGPSDLVYGTPALNSQLMDGATRETLNGVDSLGDSMGAGIPLVTLITAGYREFGLMSSGKTDFGHSAKNVGLDLAGTGGGGFAGAQAGALIGAVGGPVGAAIGGVVGGIIGAMGGRQITNSIKLAPYNQALESYQSAFNSSRLQLEAFQDKQKNFLERSYQDVNDELNVRHEKIAAIYKARTNKQLLLLEEAQQQFVDDTPTILRSIKKQLVQSETNLKSTIKRSNIMRRLTFPTTEDIYYEEATRWFNERYAIIDQAITTFDSPSFKMKQMHTQYKEVMEFLQSYVIENEELNSSLSSILTVKHSSENARKTAKKQLLQEISKAENEVRKLTKETFSKIAVYLREQKNQLKDYEDKLKVEKDRLGY